MQDLIQVFTKDCDRIWFLSQVFTVCCKANSLQKWCVQNKSFEYSCSKQEPHLGISKYA